LDPRLTGAERHRKIKDMGRLCVRWPSGKEAPLSASTLYRWLWAYQSDPKIESLMRLPRPSRGIQVIAPEWVSYALALVEEEAERSLFVLAGRIQERFALERPPSRSSLHRALSRELRYRQVRRRARGEGRLRRRFQAREPHDIWHADAKATFTVRFSDGTQKKVRVLSILDDATRFILCALVVLSESLVAAVTTFCRAAGRWGLPKYLYADRGSAYDADPFRRGVAILGIHRIQTRSHNAPAHGKIEAYHRSLQRWFVRELPHQPVGDLAHLQLLLDAVIEGLYHEHVHRELKQTPRQAFANAMSSRLVPLQRLHEAFFIEKELKVHPVTGEVRIAGKLFLVEKRWIDGRPRRLRFAIDPQDPLRPRLIVGPGRYEPLKAAFDSSPSPAPQRPGNEPVGPLTPLVERYRGRTLPQAHRGFGLPEIYEAFSKALDRPVPATESEATSVLEWLSAHGPFEPDSFAAALSKAMEQLGAGRPLVQILQAVQKQIRRSEPKEQRP
jgi:transposase InsO family protein